jgi:transposase
VSYARRNVVQRRINRLKHWRGLATRHEERAVNERAMVVIAAVILRLGSSSIRQAPIRPNRP